MKITDIFPSQSSRTRWVRLLGIFLTALLAMFSYSIVPLGAESPAASNIRFVSPSWLENHLEDPQLRVLDVRINPLEYINGHVPNAVHIADNTFRGPSGFLPIQYWDNSTLETLFAKAGVDNDSKVVVYSDGNDVLGATMVAYLLERAGVEDIAVLDGGYKGYTQVATTTKDLPTYNKPDFKLHDNPNVRVSLAELQQLIGRPGVEIIDPRPANLFAGEVNLWKRNGHIPGAKNIPWPTFTEANNTDEAKKNPHQLKPLSEIRDLLARRQITPDKTIIVSCSTGREATLQYIVLKHLLNYPNVRVYEGSWTEYSNTDLPFETGHDLSLIHISEPTRLDKKKKKLKLTTISFSFHYPE
ncbi:sulfurtransferase, partial [Synechococcus moorigangaii CMS01]|nr:sulfurtransferase [Synechococcus moorigangaii CMS01]